MDAEGSDARCAPARQWSAEANRLADVSTADQGVAAFDPVMLLYLQLWAVRE